MPAGRVVVVTDSTASLPGELAAGLGIVVVPLQVVIGASAYDEGEAEGEATPALVAAALREWTPVSTSRPSPELLLETYERAARGGADAIVSVHLSGQMSGTVESAQLAARRASVPVEVVDTEQVGIGTGYAALAAARAVAGGADAATAAAAARERGRATTSLFYVDTLEYLRRGGRIGTAAALFGGALAVKPLLQIAEGRVAPLERVRTSGRALGRLEELAVQAATAAGGPVEVSVAHLANPERAAQLVERLAGRLDVELAGEEISCGELGAVLGAHVGPGMIAVCVAPR
ncbi:DegV family protein [Nocardioides sp. Leaf374]|uniref:DegV family protein n=1 Tax=Nocardioides sp. Leaf374 TaxID=2876560 RepID=UPI001E2D4EF6|nr:DegV family protein [Nocardioides sp. Leaf374]